MLKYRQLETQTQVNSKKFEQLAVMLQQNNVVCLEKNVDYRLPRLVTKQNRCY